MDKIILGILMMRRATVYEIRGIISKYFQAMCSDSLGSIQAAVKKLLAAQMVSCAEYVEKGVNKKRYSITDKGREVFSQWLKIPADFSNSKNMEIGKLLFMGFVPAEERLQIMDEMIIKLKEELLFLLDVQASVNPDGKNAAIEYWSNDREYYEGVKNITRNPNMEENVNEIGYFELVALLYGRDSIKFSIEWLENLRKKMKTQQAFVKNEKGE